VVAWANILIRATNWLGDAVLSLPAARAVRERFPEARITVLARGWVAELYRREPFADEVVLAPRTWPACFELARNLRRRNFDAAILLPNSFESALMLRMAGIPRRIGYGRDRRSFLLTDAVAPPKPGEIPPHERFYYLELLRRAGLIQRFPPEDRILLHAHAEARCTGLELFRSMGFRMPVVGISPGAQNSRAKQWLPERFVESALRLAASLDAAIVLFGSAAEQRLGQAMAEAVRRAGRPVLNLAGETTLVRFIELAAACRVFLTNDSGAMHVASALAVPTVAIFGPTEYFATAPAGPRSVIVREPVECSPCMLRDCPIDHRCMTAVSAERVAETALELLK
jgi:heptosyltransferase-2